MTIDDRVPGEFSIQFLKFSTECFVRKRQKFADFLLAYYLNMCNTRVHRLTVSHCLSTAKMGIAERKEREKENRKESILDAAQKIFFEKGLHLSTMDEIAETAEHAKGTLYLYYHSKEDLNHAVLMRGLSILHAMFIDVIKQQASVVPMMVALFETYTEFYRRYPNYFRMMHFFNTPQFHKQVSEEMMRSCDAINQSLWGIAVQILTGGVADGKIRSDLDPVEMALIMWATATTLLTKIDNQHEMFIEKMHIDLNNTLKVSNMLLLEAVLTRQGRDELHAVVNQSRGIHEPG